jgi:GAF domain-containing protein
MADESMLKTLVDLAALTSQDGDIEDTAEAIVSLAQRTIDCDFAGLTVFGSRHRLTTLAPSHPIVEEADRLQYQLREGPCAEAAWEQDTFVSNNLMDDSRWPTWGPKATALGMTSLLATRLSNGERALGALNLYSAGARDFTADDRDFAQIFARQAASTLDTIRQLETLRVAVDARTLIGQAQGILMERFGLNAEQAFSVLRRYSQDRNVKLRNVAEDVIESRTLPPPP